jgi:hypothetical protein
MHINGPIKFTLYLLGLFCKSRPPDSDNNRYFFLFVFIKYLLLVFVLLTSKQKKQSFFQALLRLQVFFFFLIDLYSGISILLDNYFVTDLNQYFFSSAFTMGFSKIYLSNYFIVPLVNGIAGLVLVGNYLRSRNKFFYTNLLVFISVIIFCFILYFAFGVRAL